MLVFSICPCSRLPKPSINTPLGRCGLSTCWEKELPQGRRGAENDGKEIGTVVVMSGLAVHRGSPDESWDHLVCQRPGEMNSSASRAAPLREKDNPKFRPAAARDLVSRRVSHVMWGYRRDFLRIASFIPETEHPLSPPNSYCLRWLDVKLVLMHVRAGFTQFVRNPLSLLDFI